MTVLVSETQIILITSTGEVTKVESASVHAAISKDYIVIVDETKRLNIYNIA